MRADRRVELPYVKAGEAVNSSCEIVDLREICFEAARALARVDGEGLEGLACRCRDAGSSGEDSETAPPGCLVVLARVLEITRANIALLGRLRDSDTSPLEYGSTGNR
jgi:hypothetical protein